MREFQAFGVVHGHDRNGALLRGTATSAYGNAMFAQLAGNFFTALVGAGQNTNGDLFLPLRLFLDVCGKHGSFFGLGSRVQHNRRRPLAH